MGAAGWRIGRARFAKLGWMRVPASLYAFLRHLCLLPWLIRDTCTICIQLSVTTHTRAPIRPCPDTSIIAPISNPAVGGGWQALSPCPLPHPLCYRILSSVPALAHFPRVCPGIPRHDCSPDAAQLPLPPGRNDQRIRTNVQEYFWNLRHGYGKEDCHTLCVCVSS